MTIENESLRPLGTMVAYGFPEIDFDSDLALAARLGASTVEIFPEWRRLPDPSELRVRVGEAGLRVHSAHGCWGGQSIKADRVDLGHPSDQMHGAAVDDLRRCIDWLHEAGGTCLVVHPGGLSTADQRESRRSALARGLLALAEHAVGTGVVLCVENMPPGVFPGSRMAELAELLAELDHPHLALAVDTGHAQIVGDLEGQTQAAGRRLLTTHVHDNDGRHDTHLIPGHGTIDWNGWRVALDVSQYRGPIMLECIRQLRQHPDAIDDRLAQLLHRLRGADVPAR